MLVGLLKLRRRDGGTFGLVRLLWKQGVIWLALATAAEIPPVVSTASLSFPPFLFISLYLVGAYYIGRE
jgi:hypothetical protein